MVDDGYDLFLTMVLYPSFSWDEEAYHLDGDPEGRTFAEILVDVALGEVIEPWGWQVAPRDLQIDAARAGRLERRDVGGPMKRFALLSALALVLFAPVLLAQAPPPAEKAKFIPPVKTTATIDVVGSFETGWEGNPNRPEGQEHVKGLDQPAEGGAVT